MPLKSYSWKPGNYAGMYTKDCAFYDIAYLVDLFNLILYLFHEDYIQPEATSSSPLVDL
jgi:hypothetical protein